MCVHVLNKIWLKPKGNRKTFQSYGGFYEAATLAPYVDLDLKTNNKQTEEMK